ncbi:activating transcription factor 4b [Synchiropus splendidus]|uniref:activating transcription factor 4b n=1 Tax=Synchiropus splendidus TaxID=270530 RepID=UPI00237E2C9C|nr:activating transcription factor 4b [Synchiropus splendidus]
MTMMMTSSQFGLEDMEDLLLGPSSPMADPLGSLLFHPDLEEHHKSGGGSTSMEGLTSPLSPLTASSPSSSPSPPFYSPPQSPSTALHGGKAHVGALSVPWSEHPGQASSGVAAGDAYGDLDWMTEKMDLSEFDLDSLIGCGPDQAAGSHDDLLASLDCPMEFDALPLPADPEATAPCSGSPAPPEELRPPSPEEKLEIKSEPASSSSSPAPSPADTLELGSEVDVADSEVKPLLATVAPEPHRFVLSLSPTRILLVLTPKSHLSIPTEMVHRPGPTSPPPRSSRSRPYPEPRGNISPSSSTVTSVNDLSSDDEETTPLKTPRNKKLKKMEQNKTAATRYRQKKRAEQEALTTEFALLQKKNVELTERAESMAREIEYLKELMDEVRMARMKRGLSADL